jgi:hypothetical protein
MPDSKLVIGDVFLSSMRLVLLPLIHLSFLEFFLIHLGTFESPAFYDSRQACLSNGLLPGGLDDSTGNLNLF